MHNPGSKQPALLRPSKSPCNEQLHTVLSTCLALYAASTALTMRYIILGLSKQCRQAETVCRVDHIHSPAENGWKEYQREYGYKQTGYGPQGSHEPPNSQKPKTSIFGGLKDTAGKSLMAAPILHFVVPDVHAIPYASMRHDRSSSRLCAQHRILSHTCCCSAALAYIHASAYTLLTSLVLSLVVCSLCSKSWKCLLPPCS